MATQLSQSFTLEEMYASETARKRGIDNTPTEQVTNRLKYLCEKVLQPVRDHFGEAIVVTSGYRSPVLNKAVGSSSSSFHCLGCAADIRFAKNSKRTMLEIFKYIHENLPYTELIAEELPDGWVHVAIEKGRDKEKQLKYKLLAGGVKRGTYEEILAKFPK